MNNNRNPAGLLKRIYSTDSKGVTHCTIKVREADGRITFTTIY